MGWRISIMVIFAILAVTGFLLSIVMGSVEIPVSEIIGSIMGTSAGIHENIFLNIRLPRTVVGALVGINLALSGAILQAIMKNPLADPHIIGISSGAGIAGIMVILMFPGHEMLITPVAFIGAMLAAVCIYILAWKNGIRPVRIILAGVAVSAFLGAGISGMMIFNSDRIHNALMWMVGGLSARGWAHASMIWPYSLSGGLLAFLAAGHINILQLGDDVARGLGVRVELTRVFLTAVAAILAASAVSVAGLLGFVGLVVPHAARLLIGSDYRFLLPASALLGMALVTIGDTMARTVFAPIELPVGILMAVLGAPFFLFLLRREL
ncbi:MAG: iron ABC transporter permease [Anaerovibrio sp.]|uniref:FecCD family ABC transporter permease n=1 Tax=Anaerovibrio sp. TaxID=1872532 RepID=UPI0025FD4385|nr:iron ABC transporter permease [Anaerovibrio sp.]MCR5176781.1 iron ABC transporter permease [Anaerovibrio sp.]